MADFIASMIAGIFTLIICAFALYASIISFSLFDYAFRWFDAFGIVLSSAGILISFAAMIFACHELLS
ncbi:hypothetical protein K6K15_04130 [Lacticaseibacillus paracasei]|uniref:hypothetical protein n=1 Tax=Lacticaseibacillus paracasei TaxID=1597 RepID=UPI002729DB8F|nr:hypothetical protein [Lacticaseibacillus paracasei]WKZ96930.1 hypothetical protein K6K15_04130 [Lacticaseibacillus paracasei]